MILISIMCGVLRIKVINNNMNQNFKKEMYTLIYF